MLFPYMLLLFAKRQSSFEDSGLLYLATVYVHAYTAQFRKEKYAVWT